MQPACGGWQLHDIYVQSMCFSWLARACIATGLWWLAGAQSGVGRLFVCPTSCRLLLRSTQPRARDTLLPVGGAVSEAVTFKSKAEVMAALVLRHSALFSSVDLPKKSEHLCVPSTRGQLHCSIDHTHAKARDDITCAMCVGLPVMTHRESARGWADLSRRLLLAASELVNFVPPLRCQASALHYLPSSKKQSPDEVSPTASAFTKRHHG